MELRYCNRKSAGSVAHCSPTRTQASDNVTELIVRHRVYGLGWLNAALYEVWVVECLMSLKR
jgi:hypothetical protein